MPLPFGLGFLPVIDVNEHGIFVVFDALDKGCEESFDEEGVNTSFWSDFYMGNAPPVGGGVVINVNLWMKCSV